MKKVNEAIIAGVIILYANGEPATGKTVTAKVYDETYTLFSEPAVSEITGTGVYYTTFTPDTEGFWTIIFDCADPNVTRAYSWYVQEQVADDIDTLLSRVSANVALASVCTEVRLAHLDADISSRAPSGEYDTQLGATERASAAALATVDANIDINVADTPYLADAALPATPTAGSIGRLVKDYLDATISSRAPASEYDTEMARITADVATEAKQDIIDTVVDAIKVQTDKMPRLVSFMDFWSDKDDEFLLNTTADDKALPDVVVSGLPADITIIRVVAMFMCRAIEDTSGGANAINGEQYIQVRKAAGSWTNAIKLVDNLWAVAASTREMGDAFLGNIDLHTTVDGDATYNFQTHNVVVDGVSLKFNDLQVGLRVYFTV